MTCFILTLTILICTASVLQTVTAKYKTIMEQIKHLSAIPHCLMVAQTRESL